MVDTLLTLNFSYYFKVISHKRFDSKQCLGFVSRNNARAGSRTPRQRRASHRSNIKNSMSHAVHFARRVGVVVRRRIGDTSKRLRHISRRLCHRRHSISGSIRGPSCDYCRMGKRIDTLGTFCVLVRGSVTRRYPIHDGVATLLRRL